MNPDSTLSAIRAAIAAALWFLLTGPALGYIYFFLYLNRHSLPIRFIPDIFGLTYIILGPSALIAGLVFGGLLSVARLMVEPPVLQTILAAGLGFLSGCTGISLAHHLTDGMPLIPANLWIAAYYINAGKVGVVCGVTFVLIGFLSALLKIGRPWP
jgi:hypothetical protein